MQVDDKTVKAPKLSEEDVGLITGMGYLQADVRRCLKAANGNADIALRNLHILFPDVKPHSFASAPVKALAPATGRQPSLLAALAQGEKTAPFRASKDSITKENEENRRLTSPVVSRTVDSEQVKEKHLKSMESRSKSNREKIHKKNRLEHTAATGRSTDLQVVTEDDDEFGNMSDDNMSENSDFLNEAESDRDFLDRLGKTEEELQQEATFTDPTV